MKLQRDAVRVYGLIACVFAVSSLFASPLSAQSNPEPDAPPSPQDAGTSLDPSADAPPPEAAPDAALAEPAPVAAEPEPPRGDTPVALEEFVAPKPEAPAPQPTATTPEKPKPEQPSKKPKDEPAKVEQPAPGPLVTWASAGWAAAFGPAHCGPKGLDGADVAIRIASTLKRSAAAAGLGIATAGALGDHPLLAHAARQQPEQLAALIAGAGFSVVAVGVSEINGPLLRDPRLADALRERGVTVAATNLVCADQAFCRSWATAEDPLPIIERDGRRYALIAELPDDLLGRVEPTSGRRIELRPSAEDIVARTEEARKAGAELIIASIDHGPDATAASILASFITALPLETRPDLMLSPSSGDSLLFMRPLDVTPAIVATRPGVLMGIRVTKLPDGRDSDVFARSVRLDDWNDELATQVRALGESYCPSGGQALPGGQLEVPLTNEGFIEYAASAVRDLADADLALVDPLTFERAFAAPEPVQLQRGQVERAVVLDSPLVTASVPLDWLGNLNKILAGPRPLTLIGPTTDGTDALIAGRIPVTGALYRIVTTAVLARSGRLPGGPTWSPVRSRNATLRGALLSELLVRSTQDPRTRIHDPKLGTQWVWRTDGQVQTNLTDVDNPDQGMGVSSYTDPALQVQDSFQLGGRLVINLDADAPGFLFENAAQIAFDRNFTTKLTATDQIFLQTTYTYRGLWPSWLLYPHPFVEGYLETQFTRGNLPYHHLMVRPKIGLRSMASRVLSLKLSAGFQYEVLDPNASVLPGIGAELLLKPWTIPIDKGTLQLEGNIIYFWDSPGDQDRHTLRAQLIAAFNMIGPLQLTLSTIGTIRKDPGMLLGKGFGLQAGIRVRFVARSMTD
ncbi:MAG: hypothetical protein ABW321_22380 [Polyangiales bacterium]